MLFSKVSLQTKRHKNKPKTNERGVRMNTFSRNFLKREERNKDISIAMIAIGPWGYTMLWPLVFKQKTDKWVLLFLFALAILIYTRFKLIKYRVENGFYGTTADECREMINLIVTSEEIFPDDHISWWVDSRNLWIMPVVMIPATPSFTQLFTNLFRRGLLKHNKYYFRILKKNGKLGKKLTGDYVYSQEEEANRVLEDLILRNIDDPRVFKYKYQVYPFDSGFNHFFVVAENQEKADKKATVKITELFNQRRTVMTKCYPIKK
jgi:hypothetical protein